MIIKNENKRSYLSYVVKRIRLELSHELRRHPQQKEKEAQESLLIRCTSWNGQTVIRSTKKLALLIKASFSHKEKCPTMLLDKICLGKRKIEGKAWASLFLRK